MYNFEFQECAACACIICEEQFSALNLLIDHYEKAHYSHLACEVLNFESFEELEEWIGGLLPETLCQFVRQANSLTETQETDIYFCRLSECYESENANTYDLNTIERVLLEFHCPAQLKVIRNRNSGSYIVKYKRSRVRHQIRAANDPEYVQLEKNRIMTEMWSAAAEMDAIRMTMRAAEKLANSAEMGTNVVFVPTNAAEMQQPIDAEMRELKLNAVDVPLNDTEIRQGDVEIHANDDASKTDRIEIMKVTLKTYSFGKLKFLM